MAKRFTDTDKWKRPWFRQLPLKAKSAWFYVLDNCDHAGVWPADFELLSFQLGVEITREEFEGWFGDKAVRYGDKYSFPSFVEFQYGELNPHNNAHKSVIHVLEKLAPAQPLKSPSQGAQDKDKDKDQDQEKGGVGENKIPFEPTQLKPPSKLPPSEFVHDAQPLDASELDLCYQAWLETLAFYKAGRAKLLPAEQLEIVRTTQRQGNATAVLYALRGARYEPKTEKFNPADFLKINRILAPEQFNRFMNLGIQAEHKKAGGS